ncbi:MAG: selenide, water dikinase SelD [Actinomycetota bacterium]|jgi:selenide,water dikinase
MSGEGQTQGTATVRLTEWTSCGGCAAKWGASLLAGLVTELPPGVDRSLLVGLAPFDDAAVYRLTDDLALVSTTDFFPPLVDDPSDFGAIAAANACSDVFAMGGEVVLAVNIAAFPEHMPRSAITAILAAASDTVREAGGTVAGGHTIRNPEPVFGLAVQGTVHPDRVFRKSGARPGDAAVLSKPLGTGLVTAAGTEGEKRSAIHGMRQVNRGAAAALRDAGTSVHAVTDVTGYGLAGHGWEMADRSGVNLRIDTSLLPLYPGAARIAAAGTRTGGDPRNREYVGANLVAMCGETAVAVCMDPQTSGGLLAAVDPAAVDALVSAGFTLIGGFTAGTAGVMLA